ncbi:phosphoenolpyruvate carboxykinase (ATP), partial [bacterium]|nr:phosphoenolpyruvate carboxykinase (ATP) [bacterium]
PEHHINIAMGSDYMGENKKGFLRQAMWNADKMGMLGLHAGDKLVTVKDAKDGKLKKYGVLLFGLSATGKSTWSCHRLGLDEKIGEGTQVIQDDICFMRSDGSAYGSESNFFVKTDVDKKLQEAMYYSLADKSALYENVFIDYKGNPDFLDESLCGNGRAVIQKSKIRIMRGRKLVRIDYPGLNLPSLDELDGIVFAFITRRNTFMPFAQELTAKQAVLAYLWGESSHSMASQPLKAGESVRTVGTDPFIIGSRGKKVNHFREIIEGLCDKYPGKVKFFQYNTGGVGEIIETKDTPEGKVKSELRKTTRIPIPIMAGIQRGDLRGVNKYEQGRLGTKEIIEVEGSDLSKYDAKQFYSSEQIDDYVDDLVKGRREFTEQVNNEDLDPQILKWAEDSFEISSKSSRKIFSVGVPPAQSVLLDDARNISVLGSDGSSLLERPPRSFGWRLK